VWTKILDAEGYEATMGGEIRNARTKQVLKQHIGSDGYMRIQLAGRTRLVHRIIADTFVLKPIGKEFVNHIDGNKTNNSAFNLEWVTRSENMQHAYNSGLKKPLAGTKNGHAKLTEEAVAFIRENYVPGDKEFGAKALGKKFGVAHQTVAAVFHKQNWN
jgi:hypothetical protein